MWSVTPLLLCMLAHPVTAHNGRVALAYPVENITLDGDLSDWPTDFVSYAIDTPRGGDLPRDANDFEASFRVGYNLEENAFYLAVKMRDESMVLDGADPVNMVYPTNRDACTPIIHFDQEKFKPAIVFQPTWPVVVGDERHAMTAGTEVAFTRDAQAHYYEWRVDAGQTEDPVELRPGQVIGLMMGLWDRDADGSSTFMAWGQGHFNAPTGLGDVVLVSGETAQLTGTVQWPDQSQAGYVRVRIRSLQSPQTWVQVETDAQGSFAVELPADAYRIEALGQHVEVKLQPGASEHVALVGQFPQGQELEIVQRVKKATAGPRQGPWQTFGVAQGLDSREMFAMHHDRQDRMWFGAINDLIRYDGREFVYFATPEGPINYLANDIAEDRQGHLWFTSFRGVFRYDGEHFVQFTTQDGLLEDVVYGIYEDSEGYLWLGSEGGVSRYDGERFVHFTYKEGLVEGGVARFAEDAQGRLYFSGFKGFSRYDGETFEDFYPRDSEILGAFDLHIDRSGHLWTSWMQGGITRFDGETFENIRAINGIDISRNWVTGIAEDHRGDLWFSIMGRGVFRFDGEKWQHYGAGDALDTGMVFSIYKDRHEGLWMTVGGGILVRYDDYQFNNLTTENGLSNNHIMTVVEDQQGDLFLGTKRDINHYDGKNFTQVASSVGDHYWRSRKDHRGHLWFTSSGGVHRFDGAKWRTFTTEDGLADNRTKGITEDSEGHIWVADPGLSRYNGKTWTSFTVADGLASQDTGDLAVDDQGDLWIGRKGGVDRFDGEQFTHFDLGEEFVFRHWGDVHRGRDGTMWFGSNGGLVRFDGREWRHFTTADGLLSNRIKALWQDSQNRLWMGGWGSGVALFDGLVFQHMLQNDGLVSDVVQQIFERQNGQFAIATEAGLTLYRPSAIPPSIHLMDVTADRDYGPVESLEIPSSQSYLRFEFQGASLLTPPERMAYVYRLGSEDQWQVTRDEFVEYGDLPRGDYTFEVKAVDRDLNYSAPVAVEVQIHLPYERIGWISSLALALLLAAWQTRRIVRRDRALHQSNELLEQQTDHLEKSNVDLEKARLTAESAQNAAEAANRAKSLFLANMSHEIRTPMNAILGYAQILQRSDDLPDSQHKAVATIQSSGDHLLDLINNILDISKIETGRMELQAVDFDLQNLLQTVATLFEMQCREKGLSWSLETLPDAQVLVRGDENKLRQILFNLLGNAYKFTDEGQVRLSVQSPSAHRYRFEVIDTGPGISPQEQQTLFQAFQQGASGLQRGGTGLGLTISQRQLGLMGSQLQVESALGEGARFFFEIELPLATGAVRSAIAQDYRQVERLVPGRAVQILIADDVAENRDILQSMLTDIGCSVETADNGREALECVERLLPDLVFMDIRMPVLGGVETLELIRENEAWSQVKVVAISASVLEHERREYLASGFDDFIDKPFRFERICQCLVQQLGVEYDYEEASIDSPTDWSRLNLPAKLQQKLREAAELYSVTEMEDYLNELEQISNEHHRLAAHLRQLNQNQDMNAILTILADISHD